MTKLISVVLAASLAAGFTTLVLAQEGTAPTAPAQKEKGEKGKKEGKKE